jgi:hypothetical protein
MAVYEPVTFHLNINVGDCTILCLKETTVRSPKTLPALHKVVLIDGGYPNWNGGHSAAVIRQFLTVQLPLLFDLEEYPGGVVLIDTVVITHWDYDHYGGIASLLVDDLTPAKDQPAKTQFKHFRYSNAGVPLTWMYVPYMTSSDKQRPPYHIFALSDSTTDRLKFNISVNPGHPQWCENICLLRYGADQVMGVNFFTNVQSPAAVGFPVRPAQLTDGIVPVTLFENPALLINSFTDINDDDPGLFCIACNNFVFQKPTEVEESPPENALEKAANTAFPTLHPHVLIVDVPISSTGGSDSEQTNSASIIAILAWKNTKSDGTRVSHYLAGDALWEQEAAVANWLAPTCKVTNIKLSHHGAALSSPASLFRMLNPVNVIVSAGTSHGHPRTSILSA